MKTVFVLTIALAVLTSVAFWRQPLTQLANSISRGGTPFACDVHAMTPAQRKRHFDELGPALRTLRTATRELPNGFEFEFPADGKTNQLVTEWAAGERVCCPFLDIQLLPESDGAGLRLRLTGKEGVKQFLRAEGVV